MALATLGIFDGNDREDALPVDFNIIESIDFTGPKRGAAFHIQSSNFNVIANCRLYNTRIDPTLSYNCVDIYINGNETHPATYNIIYNNEIFNTPYEGVYIGKGSSPQYNNYGLFNHVLKNEIYTQGSEQNAELENAIDIKEYNYGNVVERNLIRDMKLITVWNGAIDVRHDAHHTLVYGNIIKNITKEDENDVYHTLSIGENADYPYVYNNLIYNQNNIETVEFYAISVEALNNSNSYVAHNTIYNYPRGLLLVNGGSNFTIANNIIGADIPLESWSDFFTLSNNLYTVAPTVYLNESGRQIGNPYFADPNLGDFRLTSQSTLAIDNGVDLNPSVDFDINMFLRSSPNDIGAYEFGSILSSIYKFQLFDIFVYPNPVTNDLTINCCNCNNENFEIRIIDIYGRNVMQNKHVTDLQKIDVSALKNSIYFVQLIDNNTIIETIKIIKQ